MRELTRPEQLRLIRNATLSSALVGAVACGGIGFLVSAVAAMANAAGRERAD